MAGDILLSGDSLTRTHGTRTLFQGVSLGLFEGDRVGLVGPNGSGKSTMLKILAGLETPDAGTVSRRRGLRVGFVTQSPELPADLTVEQVAERALGGLGLAEHEIMARTGASLGRAGFTDFDQRAGSLSGGWKKRLSIACELAKEPDLLLLDEPTNHLDVEGILWLEELLVGGRVSCLVVSHDRWFLQDVTTRMMELNRTWTSGLFTCTGNYADFLERRDEALAAQHAAQASLANVVRREIEWLRRGPKARTTKSEARIKEAERLKAELAAGHDRLRTASAGIDFTSSDRRSKRLVVAHGVSKSLGGRCLIDGLDLTLVNGMRLGVIGANGSGKTTLMRLLAGELEPDEGRIDRAPGLKVLRFEQDRESLDPAMPLQRALAPAGDQVIFRGEPVHVASWARRFLFRNEQLQIAVGKLSGGEQARILIARLMLREADVLMLDEPTNDLDIATLEVLEESLVDFPGALILVTHDRYMLDRVSTSLLAVEGEGQLTAYADLAQWEMARRAAPAAARAKEAAAAAARAKEPPKGLKALTNRERQEWAGMEEAVLRAEQALAAARAAAEDPSIARDAGKLHERHEKLAAASAEVDRLYERWAELEAKQA